MASTEVRVHERYAWHGQSLLITTDRGDCTDADALTGFYFREARYLRMLRLVVDGEATVRQAHSIAVDAEHALLHAVPRLTAALVHADPAPTPGETDPHLALAHHGHA